MKDFDFISFKKELKENTIASLAEYKQKHGFDDLCGFAFYTDDSFMTLSVFIDLRSRANGNPKERDYYRFTVDEWTEEGYPNEKFDHINELLTENNDSSLDDLSSFDMDMDYINGLCNCFTEVIWEMQQENYFDGVKDEFVWNIGISSFDNPPLFIDIFKRLNTAELAQEYEKFLIKEYKTFPSEQWSYKKGKWVERY